MRCVTVRVPCVKRVWRWGLLNGRLYKVVIPYSISGITSGVVLGIGRAIGETMAVLMVTGNAAVIPTTSLSLCVPFRLRLPPNWEKLLPEDLTIRHCSCWVSYCSSLH